MNVTKIITEECEKFIDEFNVDTLPDLNLKTNAPQISRGGIFNTNVTDVIEVLDDRFEPNKLYDYIVDGEGNLIIGDGHYKLTKKAKTIKAAGEIKVDNLGKVTYLNNESGHYKPTRTDLNNIVNKFKELKLQSSTLTVDNRY